MFINIIRRILLFTFLLSTISVSVAAGSEENTANQNNTLNSTMPTATYGFTNQVVPAPDSFSVPEDTQLKITFDSPPTLGSGRIRIMRSRDDVEVDSIGLTDESDSLGYQYFRTIKTNPINIDGKTVRIALHLNKLALGEKYYVVIPKSVFLNANLAGQVFDGIGKQSGWDFTTRLNKPDTSKRSLIVNDDGQNADFRTIQGALNFVMQYVPKDSPVTINVKNGIYEEPLYLRNKNNITIKGESKSHTIIRYRNNEGMNIGASGRSVFLIENSDRLTLEALSIINTTLIGQGGQAETLYYNSQNGRLIAKNANFISEQDTLSLKGWTWFYHTLVAGNVDFIWGYSKASLFENSEIRTIGDSRGYKGGGYILQARVQHPDDPGYIFLNSQLTRGKGTLGHTVPDGRTFLGRSGGCAGCYDNIVFVNTKMDKHIRPVGWFDQPLPTPREATTNGGWREFNSMDMNGNTLDFSERLASHSKQLTKEEVKAHYCSRKQIFAGFNNGMGWDPMPENKSNCGLIDHH